MHPVFLQAVAESLALSFYRPDFHPLIFRNQERIWRAFAVLGKDDFFVLLVPLTSGIVCLAVPIARVWGYRGRMASFSPLFIFTRCFRLTSPEIAPLAPSNFHLSKRGQRSALSAVFSFFVAGRKSGTE